MVVGASLDGVIGEGLFEENCLWGHESFQDPAERTACAKALRWRPACILGISKAMWLKQLSQGERDSR